MRFEDTTRDWIEHPVGSYSGVVTAITDPEVSKFEPEKEFRRIQVETEARDEDGREMSVSRFVTDTASTRGKLYSMISGILGHRPGPDEEVNLPALVGRPVTVTVERTESGKSRIASLAPYSGDNPYVAVADRDEDGDDEEPEPIFEDKPKVKTKAKSPMDVVVHVGVNKGSRVGDLTDAQLTLLAERWSPKADKSDKADKALLKALEYWRGEAAAKAPEEVADEIVF